MSSEGQKIILSHFNGRAARVVSLVLLLAMPTLMAFLLPWAFFGAGFDNYMPVWTDEIEYWVEANTVLEQGLFQPAYFGAGEVSSAVRFMPFVGSHGPGYPALAAAFGYVFGWKPYSGVLLNITALTLALLAYVCIVRPSIADTFLALGVVVLCWALVLYLNTTMQESIHQAVGIVMAAAFYRLLAVNKHVSLKSAAVVVFLISASTLFRPIWGFLLFPLALMTPRSFSFRPVTITLMLAFCLSAALARAYFSMVPPYPYAFVYEISAQARAMEGGFLVSLKNVSFNFVSHALQNARMLIVPGPASSTMEMLVRYQMLALFAVLSVLSIRAIRSGFRGLRLWGVAFPAIFLGLVLFIQVILYDINAWRDFRYFSSFLLMALMFLIACGRRRIVAIVLLSSFVFLPAFVSQYRLFHAERYAPDLVRYEMFQKEVVSRISFQEDKEPWCNNILVGMENFHSYLMGLSPDFVFNFALNWFDTPYRPRYVLMNPKTYRGVEHSAMMRPLARTSFGTLYLNLDSPCTNR